MSKKEYYKNIQEELYRALEFCHISQEDMNWFDKVVAKSDAYDNLVSGEVEKTIKEYEKYLKDYRVITLSGQSYRLYDLAQWKQIKSHIQTQAKELNELKKKGNEYIKAVKKFESQRDIRPRNIELQDELCHIMLNKREELEELFKGADRQ